MVKHLLEVLFLCPKTEVIQYLADQRYGQPS
nr:MAG TPA: hypothetical protein [Caudoviricetes sp.]